MQLSSCSPGSLVPVTLIVIMCFTAHRQATAQPGGFNYNEDNVPEYTLPDPLVFSSGKPVKTAKQWNSKRRPELLELFKEHEYGSMPPAREIDQVEMHGQVDNWLEGKGTLKEVTLHLTAEQAGPRIRVLILTPPRTQESESFPAFLGYNFNGNHTVHASEEIGLSNVWDRKRGSKPQTADESTRGKSASRWQVEKILSRGYALVTVYYGDVDPDFYDGFENGVHALYPEYQQRDDNWTSIGAWAWGASRVLDYLETDDLIDADQVAVFGHSRLGKTSLWAGASDQRFAMVISNDSGCGGAALARREFGETVARINKSFPHWFCENHKQYGGNVSALPVDQHELLALIAPRPLYVASAQDDQWADPRGEFLSCVGADPVYRLLGTEGLPTDQWPEVNEPVQGQIGYHVRTGKHDVTAYDWEQYLNFADKHFEK